jgi:hypothetical protein
MAAMPAGMADAINTVATLRMPIASPPRPVDSPRMFFWAAPFLSTSMLTSWPSE